MKPTIAVEISPPVIDLSSYKPIPGDTLPLSVTENHATTTTMNGTSEPNQTGNTFKTRPQHAKSPYFPARRRSQRLSRNATRDITLEDEEPHAVNGVDAREEGQNGHVPRTQVNGHGNASGPMGRGVCEEDILLASIEPPAREQLLQFIASHRFFRQGRFPVRKSARRRFTEDLRWEAAEAQLDQGEFDGLLKYVRRTYLELYGDGVSGLDAMGDGEEFGEEIDDEPGPADTVAREGRKRKRESIEQGDVTAAEQPNVLTRGQKKRRSNAAGEYSFRLSSAGIGHDGMGMGSFQELESVSIPSNTPNRGTPVRESFQGIESGSGPRGTPVLNDGSVVYESDYANYGRRGDIKENHQGAVPGTVEPSISLAKRGVLHRPAQNPPDPQAAHIHAEHTPAEDTQAEDTRGEYIQVEDTTAEDTQLEDTQDTQTEDTEAENIQAGSTHAVDRQAENTQAVDMPAVDTPAEGTQEDMQEDTQHTRTENAQPDDAGAENTQNESAHAVDTPGEGTPAEDTQPEDTQEDTQAENTEAEDTQAESIQAEITQPEVSQAKDAQAERTQPENPPAEDAQMLDTQANHIEPMNIAPNANAKELLSDTVYCEMQCELHEPSKHVLPGQPASAMPSSEYLNAPEQKAQQGISAQSTKPRSRRTERNYRKRLYRRRRIAQRKRELAGTNAQQVQPQNPASIEPAKPSVDENPNGVAEDDIGLQGKDF